MKAAEIIDSYINFFKKQGHKQIANSPLVPENDPTTLFTSSGMQPLVPYLLGETHPQGRRLVNVQNSFRAVDIDEIGDNRHTTFFRMLGNWSIGDYFKTEQLPWIYRFLTNELKLDPHKLYVTVFAGGDGVGRDDEAKALWTEIFASNGIKSEGRIFEYGVDKNWWSRSGPPKKMPTSEPGGPDSEIFYDFGADLKIHEKSPFKNQKCHVNCDCGRFIEIANSVFMQYQKAADGSLKLLAKPNVDFGGGLERMLLAIENQPDVFQTSLFSPIIKTIEEKSESRYRDNAIQMRIIADHIISSCFIITEGIKPSKTEQGYILRRLIRRALDNLLSINGRYEDVESIAASVVEQYKDTDPVLVEKYEMIKLTIQDETEKYKDTLNKAIQTITAKANIVKSVGDELTGSKEISVDDAFLLYSSHGLSPAQIKSLGYTFDEQAFAEKMKEHKSLSRSGAGHKFAGGLADHQDRTIMGHTATHLLHKALRDVLGNQVHQTGSNITTERVRFDFSYDQKLTDEEIGRIEQDVNDMIKLNLKVHYDLLPLKEARKVGAIGLFDDKYAEKVKVYFIGPEAGTKEINMKAFAVAGEGELKQEHNHDRAYSKEFCGGPHVDFTGRLKSFKIIKQENIGNKQRRIYAVVG